MTWVVAIPALPAATFLLFLVLSRSMRMRLLWLPVTVSFISLGLSLAAFAQVWPGGSEEAAWRGSMLFAVIGGHELELSMALDPIAAVTLLVVTVVGCCVQVYSFGYMHGEKREGWYFGVLSLFTSAMLVLVLSSDLLLTFMAWEMMGLCSYLLIGFWFEQEAPRKASQKAFLTTRVGDMGFLLALFVIFATIGEFSYEEILGSSSGWPTTALAIAGGGLVLAAMGKSAQIPLHVWLPDAMAGPTPASALIHAATMVAAGIYVVARMLPLIALTPWVMTAVLYIGVATALMGSLLACVQHDVKKVLAYSTISQLGYMFIALGAGNAEVALFHLTTHAYFKSLLFLGAGVIIHAAHTQDMRLMGGLGPKMPYTAGAFTVGCLALAGIFPLSGFFSKDEIIAILLHEEHFAAAALALLASGLTAFYVARMLFRVFSGPAQSELHEGSPTMVGPLLVLAGITLVLGWASPAYANFLGGHGVWPELAVALPSLAVAGAGFTAGWWVYGRSGVGVNTRIYKDRYAALYGTLERKFYFDTVYEIVILRPFSLIADALAVFDRRVLDGIVNAAVWAWSRLSVYAWRGDDAVIDGLVNGTARVDISMTRVLDAFDLAVIDGAVDLLGNSVRRAGAIRKIHTGNVQTYAVAFAVAAIVLVLVFVR